MNPQDSQPSFCFRLASQLTNRGRFCVDLLGHILRHRVPWGQEHSAGTSSAPQQEHSAKMSGVRCVSSLQLLLARVIVTAGRQPQLPHLWCTKNGSPSLVAVLQRLNSSCDNVKVRKQLKLTG